MNKKFTIYLVSQKLSATILIKTITCQIVTNLFFQTNSRPIIRKSFHIQKNVATDKVQQEEYKHTRVNCVPPNLWHIYPWKEGSITYWWSWWSYKWLMYRAYCTVTYLSLGSSPPCTMPNKFCSSGLLWAAISDWYSTKNNITNRGSNYIFMQVSILCFQYTSKLSYSLKHHQW